jgi:hypothetical protein
MVVDGSPSKRACVVAEGTGALRVVSPIASTTTNSVERVGMPCESWEAKQPLVNSVLASGVETSATWTGSIEHRSVVPSNVEVLLTPAYIYVSFSLCYVPDLVTPEHCLFLLSGGWYHCQRTLRRHREPV